MYSWSEASTKKNDKAINNNVKSSLVPFACTFEMVKCRGGGKQFSILCAVVLEITFGKTHSNSFPDILWTYQVVERSSNVFVTWLNWPSWQVMHSMEIKYQVGFYLAAITSLKCAIISAHASTSYFSHYPTETWMRGTLEWEEVTVGCRTYAKN